MQNIEELNLVTDKLAAKPNYSLENRETSIEVYFNDKNQVLIVGVVDNNYIYWASLTGSDDKEMNGYIFDYISRGKIRKVTQLYKAVESAGLRLEDVRRWVKICLTRKPGDPMSWLTPFRSNYTSSQIKNNGAFFAKDIAYYMTGTRGKCGLREAGGAYEKVLDYYLGLMNEDNGEANYYYQVKNVIDILESEDYLYGSENPEIRRKYIQLREYGEKLYNRHMRAGRE